MIMPITHISYPLDTDKILEIATLARTDSSPYNNSRGAMKHWRWFHKFKDPYIKKVMDDLEITGWADFYFQAPNTLLGTHVDPKCRCGVNFVLSPSPAPITFYEQAVSINDIGPPTEYTYKQALLNTTVPHSVQTSSIERVLFKICIDDESYEQVVARMKYKI
jgi:hypothetical protein